MKNFHPVIIEISEYFTKVEVWQPSTLFASARKLSLLPLPVSAHTFCAATAKESDNFDVKLAKLFDKKGDKVLFTPKNIIINRDKIVGREKLKKLIVQI